LTLSVTFGSPRDLYEVSLLPVFREFSFGVGAFYGVDLFLDAQTRQFLFFSSAAPLQALRTCPATPFHSFFKTSRPHPFCLGPRLTIKGKA